jgi:hypothetical protein
MSTREKSISGFLPPPENRISVTQTNHCRPMPGEMGASEQACGIANLCALIPQGRCGVVQRLEKGKNK